MEKNIFETASRTKLRFQTSKGLITAEDLWDLPLLSTKKDSCLDDVARGLYKKLREDTDMISFVRERASEDSEDMLRFEIVKRVIEVKMAEEKQAELVALSRAKKQRILAIMAEKEDESLKGASMEELKKMLSEI